MADQELADMTAASTLDGSELTYALQGGADRKATIDQIRAGLLSESANRTANTVFAGPAAGAAAPGGMRTLVPADIPTIVAAKISDFASVAAAAAPVQSVAGRAGAVVLAHTDISGLGAAATRSVGTSIGNVVEVGGDGRISTSVLPALAITKTDVVSSQVAMLALTSEPGDVAVRTDLNKSFILVTAPASTLGNWQELLTPTDLVSSVAGKTGTVTLEADDIASGILDPARLGSGTADETVVLHGDGVWRAGGRYDKLTTSGANDGTFLLHDDTPTVGKSSLLIKSGEAQTDGTYLLGFQNNAGSPLGGLRDYGNGVLYAEFGDIRDLTASVFLISANNPVGITLNSAYQYYFGRNSSYGSIDVGIASPLPGIIKTTNGSTGLGGLQTGLLVGVHSVSVTPATDAGFVEIPVAEDSSAAGSIEYSVEVTDGTDFQTLSGEVRWSAVNKAGTVTTADPEEKGDPMPAVVSAGTLTAAFTAVAGADKITVRVNVASSLTPTGCVIRFRPHVQSVVVVPIPL